MSHKTLVLYSGGLDSRVALAFALKSEMDVYAMAINYGQKHTKELCRANEVCEKLNVPFKVFDLPFMDELVGDNPLLTKDMDLPEDDKLPDHGKTAAVPNRNMIFLSIAIAYAINIGAKSIWYAIHDSIHPMAEDCKPPFVEAIKRISRVANKESIEIITPFYGTYKSGIVEFGKSLGVDYSETWTCFNGREKACGKCTACRERLEAFKAAKLIDPLEYEE